MDEQKDDISCPNETNGNLSLDSTAESVLRKELINLKRSQISISKDPRTLYCK